MNLARSNSSRLDVLLAVKSPNIVLKERCQFFLLGLSESQSISKGHVALIERSMRLVLLHVDELRAIGLVVELVLGHFAPASLDLEAGVASGRSIDGKAGFWSICLGPIGVALVAQILQRDGTVVLRGLELLVPGDVVVPYEMVPLKSPLILNFSQLQKSILKSPSSWK